MTSYLNLATEEELAQIEEDYQRHKNCTGYELLQILGSMRALSSIIMTEEDRKFNETLKQIPISEIEKIIIKYNLRPNVAKSEKAQAL